MSKSIEYEDRVMITEKQYFDIVGDVMMKHQHHPFLNISNIYYDTKEFWLKKKRCMLRCRKTLGVKTEMTCKVKGEDGDTEYTDLLSSYAHQRLIEHNEFVDGDVKELLMSIGISPSSTSPITELRCRRLEIEIEDYLLVIDKNTYSGVIDYDIEVEAPSMARAKEVIQFYCKKYGLTYSETYKSKSSRAIEASKKALN